MSHNENGTKETRFSFLLTLFFTLLITLGVIFSYVKSFLPDIEPVSFLPAAIISAAVFSFLFHLKKRGLIFLLSLLILVIFVIITWKTLYQSAGSTFLPLYASYMKDPGLTGTYSFSSSPALFITVFLIFLSLITSAVIVFNLPSVFSLVFPFAVVVVSIFFSEQFIDPFSFMLLVSSSIVLLIARRGLIFAGPGAPRSALVSALILLILSIVLNAVIKPFSYEQSEGVRRARLSLEDFILEHTHFYVDVNTGNIRFGDTSSNQYSWIKDEKYADISGGSLLGNNRTFERIAPPETYPAYIKINEYSDYDGRGWSKSGGSDELVPDSTRKALLDISYAIGLRITQKLEEEGVFIIYPDSDTIIDIPELIDLDISSLYTFYSTDIVKDVVKEYVSGAAVYDKGIEKPPLDVDIADYFLNVSKRGYCIHFATAATLLLRMQGVPARFVTGYLVTPRPEGTDGKIAITGNDAHAWCEYYDPVEDLWKILDATPSDPSRASSAYGAQDSERGGVNVNPSGDVDDSDPDDIDEDKEKDDDEGGDKDDDQKDPAIDGGSAAKDNGQREYLEKMANKARVTWIIIIVLGSIVLSLNVGYFLGRIIFKRNLLTGTEKKRILKYHRAIILRRRVITIKTKIPDDVLNVVMKARFSPHEMTAEELDIVKKYYESLFSASG